MKARVGIPLRWLLPSLAVVAGCSVYDSSLLDGSSSSSTGTPSTGGAGGVATGGFGGMGAGAQGTGGTAGSGASTSTHGGGGASTGGAGGTGGTGGVGGVHPCDTPDQCPPGNDCKDPTCAAHVCGFMPKNSGMTCNEDGGQVCDGAGHCVECLDSTQCSSKICKADHSCATATCTDGVLNGTESDTDCGGSCVTKCGFNKLCNIASDCKGGVCTAGHCAATCTDGSKNGSETDTDCGGGTCPTCALGDMCLGPGDCQQNNCSGGVCICGGTDALISEIRSRGPDPGDSANEFVELYNPKDTPLPIGGYSLTARSDTGGSYSSKWTAGAGDTIPAHGHFLIVGSGYPSGSPRDGALSTGITDASSIVLMHGATVVDAVCYAYSASVAAHFTAAYTCEGPVIDFNPHNNTTSTDTDASIERKPGGTPGNCVDTGNNKANFQLTSPATPQDTTSPPTP